MVSEHKNHGLAYDLSLFEPETKRSDSDKNKSEKAEKKAGTNIIKLDTDTSEKAQRRKRNPVLILVISLLTIAVTAICSLIVYNNVLINEYNEKILTANQTIENQKNLQAQYQLQIDRKLTSELVKQYAEQNLGMTLANSAQKEFVSLADGDFGQIVDGEGSNSFFDSFARLFDRSK